MAPALLESTSKPAFIFEEVEWAETMAYRCHVYLLKEDDGQFSAIV